MTPRVVPMVSVIERFQCISIIMILLDNTSMYMYLSWNRCSLPFDWQVLAQVFFPFMHLSVLSATQWLKHGKSSQGLLDGSNGLAFSLASISELAAWWCPQFLVLLYQNVSIEGWLGKCYIGVNTIIIARDFRLERKFSPISPPALMGKIFTQRTCTKDKAIGFVCHLLSSQKLPDLEF